MQADLVPVLRNGALFIRMKQRRDRRDEEGRLDLVAVQHLPNAGNAAPRAEFAPAETGHGIAAVAQFVGLVIAVKG